MGLLAKADCQQLIVKAYRLFWLRLCRAMFNMCERAFSLFRRCSVAGFGEAGTQSPPAPIRESSLLHGRRLVALRELKLNSITDSEIGFGFKSHAALTDIQAHCANRSFTRRAMGFDL